MGHRSFALGFILLTLNGCLLYASGDFGCGPPRGRLLFRGYSSCNSVPFLSPSNDSRLNLELLLIDAGKLTGNLNLPTDFPMAPDVAPLRVPFDFENWQISGIGDHASKAGAQSTQEPSNSYAEGEGSRCSTARQGVEAFSRAVNAAALPAGEASILITARTSLVADCNTTTRMTDWNPPAGIHSEVGRQFLVYAAGANAFYSGDYSSAVKNFKSLENSGNSWLKETSRYMVGRTLLNSAQAGAFGQFGDLQLKDVRKDDLARAEEAFGGYLRDFPRGIYAASARGLLRRVYWLEGDQARLADAYDKAFAEAEKGNVSVEGLIQESDSKLLGTLQVDRIQSPQFLLIVDMMRMRSGNEDFGGDTREPEALTLKELEAQKGRFVRNPAFYNYLLAVFHVYVDKKPEEALALLPELPDRRLNNFDFSQQSVRALAMDAAEKFDEERKLLLKMLPVSKLPLQSEQIQLELANLEQHTGQVERVFAADSVIRDRAIRTILVEYSATPAMLRKRIKDATEDPEVMNAAMYTLLYKELTGGYYKEFQTDLGLMPAHLSAILAPFSAAGQGSGAEYRCPSLRETAAILEHNKNDAKSLNCVGEFVRTKDVHYGQGEAPPETDLGGGSSPFPVTNYSRMDGYLEVIADRQADRDARAYALFRAIRCYAPSGSNDCGKQEIPLSTRKGWFQMLHQEYPSSAWAQSLKYYW